MLTYVETSLQLAVRTPLLSEQRPPRSRRLLGVPSCTKPQRTKRQPIEQKVNDVMQSKFIPLNVDHTSHIHDHKDVKLHSTLGKQFVFGQIPQSMQSYSINPRVMLNITTAIVESSPTPKGNAPQSKYCSSLKNTAIQRLIVLVFTPPHSLAGWP